MRRGCAECLKLIRDEQTTRRLPNVLLAVGIGRRKARRVSQLRTQGTCQAPAQPGCSRTNPTRQSKRTSAMPWGSHA